MKNNKVTLYLISLLLITVIATACGGGSSGVEVEVEIEDPNYNSSLMTITSLPTPGMWTTSGTYSAVPNPATFKGRLDSNNLTVTWINHATDESGEAQITPWERYYICTKFDRWGHCSDGRLYETEAAWEAQIDIAPGENLIDFKTTYSNSDMYDLDSIVIEHPAIHEPLLKGFGASSLNSSEAELNVLLDTGGAPCEINIRLSTDNDLSSYTLIQDAIPKDPEIQVHSITLTDLRPGMEYYYDVSVTNSLGTVTSWYTKSFITPPIVITLPATDIESPSPYYQISCATLHGKLISDENIIWYASFEIDTDPSFNTSRRDYFISIDYQPDYRVLGAFFQNRTCNLYPGTTYYFRAYYYDERRIGETLSFTTPSIPSI